MAAMCARRQILANHALFGALTEQEIDNLLAYARIERYRPREVVFHKGSAGDGMMAVLGGTVKISSPSADGREIVLNVVGAGEIFGEIGLLDGRERTADATALTECELLVIRRRDFLPFLDRHPDVARRLIGVLCERLRRTTEQVEDLSFLDLPCRLAKKLLQLAHVSSARMASGAPPAVHASQRQISAMVGVSRESVNKQLGLWQREHLVTLEDGAIRLRDIAGLRAIVERGGG